MPVLIAFVTCSVLTPLFARVAVRIGLVDRPSESGLKIHAEPKPLSGGIGIVVAVLAAIAVMAPGDAGWYVAAVIVLLAVGVADDAVGLSPNLRLGAQGISGLLLAVGGLTFEPLGVFGPVAVVLGVPLLANAVNLTDGQDGLASGLALVAAFGLWAIADAPGDEAVISLAFMGALLGFLIWNRPPASVFLGDGGAYAIGGILIVIATRSSATWGSLLGSFLCLSVFALELVSTVDQARHRSELPRPGRSCTPLRPARSPPGEPHPCHDRDVVRRRVRGSARGRGGARSAAGRDGHRRGHRGCGSRRGHDGASRPWGGATSIAVAGLHRWSLGTAGALPEHPRRTTSSREGLHRPHGPRRDDA